MKAASRVSKAAPRKHALKKPVRATPVDATGEANAAALQRMSPEMRRAVRALQSLKGYL